MNWIRNKQQWRDYLLITLGTAVMAGGAPPIFPPAGGFSGEGPLGGGDGPPWWPARIPAAPIWTRQ